MSGILVAAAVIAVPTVAFVLLPLVRRSEHNGGLLPLPPDPREQLTEEKEALYRALRELAFEQEAGHLSDDDYAALRDRYEARAAEILAALDQLGPRPPEPVARVERPAATRPWTRRPVTAVLGGVALLAFGVVLGLGVARYSKPDESAGRPTPGPRPLAPSFGAEAGGPSAANAPKGPVTPEMLRGMLEAARGSLFAGRYNEAIAAYQAVLKRESRNVDALTHLALIVALGGHTDPALETFERALAIDPNYPPALLYRGQVLYDTKHDYAGAVRSWEKFLAVVPEGEDHERVAALVREARQRAAKR